MMLCLPAIYTVDGDMSWRPWNSFWLWQFQMISWFFSDVAFDGMFSALTG